MVNRAKSNRIMCINCNLCINKLRRYPALELDKKITSLLSEWVYPQIITQDDVVCEACKDLAMAKVNVFIKQEVTDDDCQQAGPSPRGHTNVCPLCGISILRRQSNKILSDNPSELHQAIYDIIQNRLAPRQITESDRVCHACWLRTRRQVLRINSLAKSLLSIKDAPQEPAPQEPATLTEPSTSGSTPAG
ncbi:uncharacterized protein LOC123876079 [Maniola jurtina]|uniref:uncharacterized protein LOC123876079 n=1 Tax=Maniola jurtina TaxID=191418 RepID=UPI001E68F1B1|nr:uncharacterized protein LOC123876079 [Maniola jurtina]XP_045778171.1 uncharacterized protein LOC123876079 [Maniola jurtina]